MRKRKTAPVVILAIILLLSGCRLAIEPTYTKEKIVESITQLCEQEYQVKPKVWLLGETVWIYLPLTRLVTKDIQWDKENMEKISKVIVGASRVLLSMKPRPQFMAVVASDTKEYGLDYTIITWIPDIVKYQLELISRNEFSRRNVIRIAENPQSLGDSEGLHIVKKEVKLEDFLAEQMMQRIQAKFGAEPPFMDNFKLGKVDAAFDKDTFKVFVQIERKNLARPVDIDIQKEILKIIAYVIKAYDFKDFLLVEAGNSLTEERAVLSRLALKEIR